VSEEPTILIIGDEAHCALEKHMAALEAMGEKVLIIHNREADMPKRDLKEQNHSIGTQMLMRGLYSSLYESASVFTSSESVTEQKIAEKYADNTGVQERIAAAQERRELKKKKRLLHMI